MTVTYGRKQLHTWCRVVHCAIPPTQWVLVLVLVLAAHRVSAVAECYIGDVDSMACNQHVYTQSAHGFDGDSHISTSLGVASHTAGSVCMPGLEQLPSKSEDTPLHDRVHNTCLTL